jgi:hypothetical protein
VRASLVQDQIAVAPGQQFAIGVEVANTSPVIDSVRAAVHGLPGAKVTGIPAELALFPGASGSISLQVELPKSFPAGRRQARVEVRSAVNPKDNVVCALVLEVAPLPHASLSIGPTTRRGHRNGRFAVVCRNEGNTEIEVTLGASDPERVLRFSLVPQKLSPRPGSSAEATLRVRAPRHIFGSERSRPINVTANAMTSVPQLEPLEAYATYVQRPQVPRGVVTALILASIVAAWAAIFSFGLREVMAQQPLTKSAPLSFFAPLSPAKSPQLASANSSTPPGFQPKDLAPLGVGGTITGTVTAPDEPGGVGQVIVEAFLQGASGGSPVSAATQSDGTYQIVGLFPGSYKVAFSAPGFETEWYPSASSQVAAKAVEVSAEATVANVDAVVHGLPGTITGQVLTGETPSPPVQVSVLVNDAPAGVTAKTGALGTYTLAGLPSPATYTLAFSAPGFLQSDEQVYVGAGQYVVANVVALQAGLGEIDGTVTDGTNPLGGVSVTASANGNTFTSATPTSGPVGRFSLPRLPTPATYLLSFSKNGFGTQSVAVDLGPGQVINNLQVVMVGGTGTISGTVTSADGTALGGVTVTVEGLATPASTQTLTAGNVGAYTISGLPTPGTYAVTFSLAGYASETLGVTLSSNGLASDVNATLNSSLGQISGTVKDAKTGTDLAGVTVSLTNGTSTSQTSTASLPAGGYTLPQLPAGTYSVTFSLAGYANQTALVHLQPGQHAVQDIALEPSA